MHLLLVVAGKFLLYLLFMFLTFNYFTFYGMMAVGLTPSQNLAAVVSSAFYSLWNLLSGFLVPKPVSITVRHSSANAFALNSYQIVPNYVFDLNFFNANAQKFRVKVFIFSVFSGFFCI